jgi:uncharacterized repeat protein (TIGR02543 family)
MFALEKTNAELVKDSYSNLGITDIEVKLAISDMYDVQHEVKPELSFDPSGGTWADGGSDIRKYEAGLETEFDVIDAPTRDGYTFVCWKGSEYQPGDKYHADSDHVFTAEWKQNDTGDGNDNTPGEGGTPGGDDKPSGSPKNDQAGPSASKLPKTGDPLHPTVALSLLLVSIGTIAVAIVKKKRES